MYGQPLTNIRIKDIKRDSTSSYAGQEQGELDMPRSPERRRCRVSPDLDNLGNLCTDDHHWRSIMMISTSSNRKLPPPIEASRAGRWPSGDYMSFFRSASLIFWFWFTEGTYV